MKWYDKERTLTHFIEVVHHIIIIWRNLATATRSMKRQMVKRIKTKWMLIYNMYEASRSCKRIDLREPVKVVLLRKQTNPLYNPSIHSFIHSSINKSFLPLSEEEWDWPFPHSVCSRHWVLLLHGTATILLYYGPLGPMPQAHPPSLISTCILNSTWSFHHSTHPSSTFSLFWFPIHPTYLHISWQCQKCNSLLIACPDTLPYTTKKEGKSPRYRMNLVWWLYLSTSA